MSMRAYPVVALVLMFLMSLAVGACKRNQTGALEHFATRYSCPEDRVTVRARPDVKFGQHTLGDERVPAPPDELKGDPARVAKWREDQAKGGQAKLREHYDSLDVFEVHGCNHEALMACNHPGNAKGGGIDTSRVSCTEAPLTPVASTSKQK